jgi:hypothetical protein
VLNEQETLLRGAAAVLGKRLLKSENHRKPQEKMTTDAGNSCG